MAERRQLADFAGLWKLDREIRHQSSQNGNQNGDQIHQFSGEARFDWQGADLILHESGWLAAPDGQGFHAERRYCWRADLSVLFSDGRFFHTLPLAGGAVQHDCPPDFYEGVYDFDLWPTWRLRWRVRGPRKDYVSLSVFTRP